jgi:hypothetical protein
MVCRGFSKVCEPSFEIIHLNISEVRVASQARYTPPCIDTEELTFLIPKGPREAIVSLGYIIIVEVTLLTIREVSGLQLKEGLITEVLNEEGSTKVWIHHLIIH